MAKGGGNLLILAGLGIGAFMLISARSGKATAPPSGGSGQLPVTPPAGTGTGAPPSTTPSTPPSTEPSSPPARQPTGTPPTATQKTYLQAADLNNDGKIDDEEMIKANQKWVDGLTGFASKGDQFILAVTQAWVSGASF